MVKTSLVESDITAGRRLLKALQNLGSHFQVDAAFWIYKPESTEWRLMIATPVLDQRGPFSTYSDIDRTVRNLNPPTSLTVQDVSVVSPREKLVRLIKKAVRVPQGSLGVRFGQARIDDTFVEDAYFYPEMNRAA